MILTLDLLYFFLVLRMFKCVTVGVNCPHVLCLEYTNTYLCMCIGVCKHHFQREALNDYMPLIDRGELRTFLFD